MGLSDKAQGIIMSIQGATIAISSYIVGSSAITDPVVKGEIIMVLDIIIIVLPYVKEALGGNPPQAQTPPSI